MNKYPHNCYSCTTSCKNAEKQNPITCPSYGKPIFDKYNKKVLISRIDDLCWQDCLACGKNDTCEVLSAFLKQLEVVNKLVEIFKKQKENKK